VDVHGRPILNLSEDDKARFPNIRQLPSDASMWHHDIPKPMDKEVRIDLEDPPEPVLDG